MPLSKTPYDMVGSEPATYGLYFGAKFGRKPGMWLIDPWGKKLEGAPISASARAELLKWRMGPQQEEKRPKYFGDEISRHLDSITLEAAHDAALRHQSRDHPDFSFTGGWRGIRVGAGCSVGIRRLCGGHASSLTE